MTPADLVVHVYAAGVAAGQVEVVAELYAEAFFGPPHNQGQVELERMVEAWRWRVEAPGFRLVVAEYGGQAIGCVYGHQLSPGTKWWDGAVEPLPDEVTVEQDGRTFAVIDMMVRKEWRRQGVAQALHGHLLVERTEERATLLVDPLNEPAKKAYAKWGYEVVGRIQPFANSPRFEAMVKVLGRGRWRR